ncbi:MAG: GNAT family N-acetyltransferase [Alphaproteobacteria bacterium]|nr:GNAT family N-acetyltransferase [Alphaproteobacteria bacterium]
MTGSYPGFSWRDAGPGEAGLLSRLAIAGWRQTYAGQMPSSVLSALEANPHQNPASWERRLARRPPDRWTRVVETEAGEPVGFLWFGQEEGRLPGYRGEIEKIYLLKPAQGRGLGRALMADTFRTLESVGLSPVVIWVFDFNRKALDFYERLGGRPLGRREVVFRAEGRDFHEIAYGWPPGGLAASNG